MKQHITIEQLNELSDKCKDILLEWEQDHDYGKPEWRSDIKNTGGRTPPYRIKDSLNILSIGQMIEFLDEHRKTTLFITKLQCGHNNFVWSTGSMTCMGNHVQDKKESKRLHESGKELCDALWEAVKEVLEGEKKI